MAQPPSAMPHPIKHAMNQQFTSSSYPQRMSDNNHQHHTQEAHGFYNNQQQNNFGGHQFGSNGAGSSSNFWNAGGHYSVNRKGLIFQKVSFDLSRFH